MDVIEVTSEQEQQQFLYLTTQGWKTGRQHKIEIWFVSYADRYYVVSERKEKAHWGSKYYTSSKSYVYRKL